LYVISVLKQPFTHLITFAIIIVVNKAVTITKFFRLIC